MHFSICVLPVDTLPPGHTLWLDDSKGLISESSVSALLFSVPRGIYLASELPIVGGVLIAIVAPLFESCL